MPDLAPRRAGPPRTVAEAMLTDVKISAAEATARELHALFADDHVSCAVLLRGRTLVTVVERADLRYADGAELGADLGRWAERVVGPEADLRAVTEALVRSGRRRLAVVGADATFLGLLCLKRSQRGFCSNRDVRARAEDGPSRSTLRPCAPRPTRPAA